MRTLVYHGSEKGKVATQFKKCHSPWKSHGLRMIGVGLMPYESNACMCQQCLSRGGSTGDVVITTYQTLEFLGFILETGFHTAPRVT